ncbi:MAG: YggS family pyridoxal phosphate-dependent enzyme [Lachnospiraceae bacterium]
MNIKDNMKEVERRIHAACERSGRDASEVTLIAVSKTKPVSMILEAVSAGMTEFGENKPQELRDKTEELVPEHYPEISGSLHWHMIGNLQTNKIKYVVGKTVLIHSIDSVKLAEAVSKEAVKKQISCDILLEVNMAEEDSKHGFSESEVISAVRQISVLPGLRIRGLMTVAPYTELPEENRCYFRKMKQLLIDINSKNIDNVFMDTLSMGMTSDYEIAVEEGATMVRVGTGIFGERNYLNKGIG